MNDRVQINSQVKQYTPNGLPQIKSDWKKTLKKLLFWQEIEVMI